MSASKYLPFMFF